MEMKLIVAIIRSNRLEAVEEKLKAVGVERINVSKVKGYGEYHNFFKHDWMDEEARIEIFTRQHKVNAIAAAVMEAAHAGARGDGVVAVIPIEKVVPNSHKGLGD